MDLRLAEPGYQSGIQAGRPSGLPQARAGAIVPHSHGVDSEVGRLRTVLLHRPGAELERGAPHDGSLLSGRLPWPGRAEQEHDALAEALRDHGVEVLYLAELLRGALEHQPARHQAVASVLDDAMLGDDLRGQVHRHLDGLDPEALTRVLIAGMTPAEFPAGRGAVYELLGAHDFIVDPLPSLLFTRDSSVWIGDSVAVASPAEPSRRREARLFHVVYSHHPRFAGITPLYHPGLEPMEGGDVLLAPGVIAVGTGVGTVPAAVERLARRAFDHGLAHTVLAVPIGQGRGAHLDTLCTMVDADVMVMHPALAYSLTGRAITPRASGLQVSPPQPFLEAAALAMGLDRLTVVDTGLGAVSTDRERCDDAGNALAIAPGVAVSYDRNAETNARMEASGIEVIRVPGSGLGSCRGGPRCMACPVSRDPVRPPGRAASPRSADRTEPRAGTRQAVGRPPTIRSS
jgi:arginine deiminase